MIDRSDRNRRFSRHLIEAMGLGSLATLGLAGFACGGNVVVDSSSGTTGGAGGQGNTSTSSTMGQGGYYSSTGDVNPAGGYGGYYADTASSSSGGVQCNPTPPPNDTVMETCIPDSMCSVSYSPQLEATLAMQLGLCDPQNAGCCGPTFDQIACGPVSEPQGSCCYVVFSFDTPCGMGRPFTVEGRARLAATRGRRDWTGSSAPDTGAIDPPTRRALAAAWTREARFEHASIASFARLALELLAVGAPSELVRDAQQAMGDEIRHAEVCFALAGAYAGAPVGPGPLSFEDALGRVTLAEVAAAAVREGCVGETLAALAAADARDAAEDPAVREALSIIAADEAAHAAMAWRLVAWAHRSGGPVVRQAITAAFAEPVSLAGEDAHAGIDEATFRAHGRLLPAELRAHAERALAEVIRPSAAALLAVSTDNA